MTGRHQRVSKRRRGLRALLGRAKPIPVLDPPGYRVPPRVAPPAPDDVPMPPVPPPAPPPSIPMAAAGIGHDPLGRPPKKPQVRLVMADGTISELPVDEDLEARAAYLIRSMLPPAPPPPVP